MKSFARFATAPIGPGLAALDDGLTVATTTAANNLQRTARSTVGHADGVRGVEFVVFGEAPLLAAIGIVRAGANLALMVGDDAFGIGWRLNTNQVVANAGVLVAGMPAVAKGEIVGLRLRATDNLVEFYKGAALLSTHTLPAGNTWYFAVSLGSPAAGDLAAIANAGQWLPAGPPAQAGWPMPVPATPTARFADLDFLAAAGDPVPHARYEGILDASDFLTQAGVHFWPWSSSPPVNGNVGKIGLLDAEGALDALSQSDLTAALVTVRAGDTAGSVASATAVGRYRCAGMVVESDARKVLNLASPHDDLDDPLHRVVFPPTVAALAWNPIPVVIGAVASVPVLPVNNDGSVGWVADRRVYISAVYDRGDLLEAGTWEQDPSGQQILFKSPTVGPVTCDCSSIGPGMQPATLSQALADIFARVGKAAWSSADAAAIDAASGYAGVGFYSGSSSPTSAREALVTVLTSYGAWWYEGADGVLRFVRVRAPEDTIDANLAFDLVDGDLIADPMIIPDDARQLTRRLAFQPNAYVHGAGDLVTDLVDVTPERRLELMRAARGLAYTARALPAQYAHADTAEPQVTCLWREVDAQSEIGRVCGIYAAPRFRHGWRLNAPGLLPLPGQVGRITSARYGLAAGRKVMVVQATRNPATGDLSLVLWG